MTDHTVRAKVALPIRVRAMSSQGKFFDEQAETQVVSKTEVVTRLRNLVDLETEVHVTNLKSNVGGTFLTAWVNTRNIDGLHHIGLELLDSEGELWNIDFSAAPPEEEKAASPVWLECQRCHQKFQGAVEEAPQEFVSEGFQVARHCDRCKASTPWALTTPDEPKEPLPAPSAAAAAPAPPDSEAIGKAQEEQRTKGRAPLKMLVKVIRHKYGTTLEDICDTENISRTGAYFLTNQNYDVGEQLKIIMPYKEGDMNIPVSARVVRQDHIKGSFFKGVAIQLEKGNEQRSGQG